MNQEFINDMKPISTTEMPSIKFDEELKESGGKILAQSGKIGWMHSLSDSPGAKFDIVIKDSLGRIKYEKRNCHSEVKQFGELINLPTFIGEELEIKIENVSGAKKIDLFLN